MHTPPLLRMLDELNEHDGSHSMSSRQGAMSSKHQSLHFVSFFERTKWEDLSDLRVEERQAGSVGFGQEDL